jgi:hypothetical protein
MLNVSTMRLAGRQDEAFNPMNRVCREDSGL